MKILALIGSPRGMQGNTGRLLEEVLAGVREGGGEVEIVSLAQAGMQPCVGSADPPYGTAEPGGAGNLVPG